MTGIPDRRYGQEPLRESEPFSRSALDSLSAHIAILDESGTITFVNKTWREFAVSNNAVGNVAEGVNYLRVCEAATGEQAEYAAAFAEGIRSVLSDQREEFALEYPCHAPAEQRWFIGRVTRFPADGRPRAVIAHENITERKQAEEALRLRDRAITASSNGIVITAPNQADNPIIYVNPAFESMTGYSAQEALGHNCRFLQGTEREQPALEELRAALREGRQSKVVLRNHKKDGTLFWNELSISPVRDKAGKLVNFIGVQEDVTRRKKAEEELRQSEERFRSLVQYASDIITVLGAEGTVSYQSPSIERILGYRPEELTGTNVFDYVHPEDAEQVRLVFAETLKNQGTSPLVEFRFRHADGTWRFLEAVGNNLLADPSVSGMVVNSRDITERKRAERERTELLLREQAARAQAEAAQQRLRAILDNLTEGVLVADAWGRAVFVNPAAGRMLGTISGETLGDLPDLWEDFQLPRAVTRCARTGESIEARVSYGESPLRVRLECLVEDGRQNVLVVMQDLSEGHRLEANQQRFLANAAHELKTPIMAILGAAELLATGEDANPATRSRLLDHIFSESRRMQRLAEALLRLSRVGWDLREPNQEIVDLREAGQRAAELVEPLVESAGLRLSIEGESARVHADPEWLQETLLVLLSNAIKHSARGGDIRLRANNSAVTVEDEGVGISSIELPYVFERFYRGKGSSEGFGLGLTICRELTERMGGRISIRSQEGVGTAVKVELPEADLDAQDTNS
ncbi:MAG TPA: PAS domain S-box protein [Rubrobacteraceae bacterium]